MSWARSLSDAYVCSSTQPSSRFRGTYLLKRNLSKDTCVSEVSCFSKLFQQACSNRKESLYPCSRCNGSYWTRHEALLASAPLRCPKPQTFQQELHAHGAHPFYVRPHPLGLYAFGLRLSDWHFGSKMSFLQTSSIGFRLCVPYTASSRFYNDFFLAIIWHVALALHLCVIVASAVAMTFVTDPLSHPSIRV